jgi:hypothetical protein
MIVKIHEWMTGLIVEITKKNAVHTSAISKENDKTTNDAWMQLIELGLKQS